MAPLSTATATTPTIPTRALLGHLAAMRDDPLGLTLRALQHGDIVRVRIGHARVFFIFRPDYVEHILLRRPTNYRKRTRGYEKLRLLLGNGLLTSEDEIWLRQRRTAQPAFHRRRIAGFVDTMVSASEALAERWSGTAGGQPIDVAREMMRLTLRIAGETLFSLDISADSDEIGAALTCVLEEYNRIVATPLPFPERWPGRANRRFWHGLHTLDRVVRRIVAQRRRHTTGGDDLLGLLMDARDPDTGRGMSDQLLRDEALTMLLAGHETTANALSWTLYLLASHPPIARRAAREVDAVIGADRLTADHLPSLRYTGQVLSEALRLYPPAWMIGRAAARRDQIGGHAIPAGAYVYVSAYAIHRHPRYWESPERFDPTRFDESAPPRPRFSYLPFGGGQRLCIGNHFARTEALTVLAALLRRFSFALVPDHPVEPEPTVTLRPRHGLKMIVTARTPAEN